jgi:hypothetical protein
MTITAVIKRPSQIIANTAQLTTTQSAPPLTLMNGPVNQVYIHSILDVVENNPPDSSTLVYNANTHKYEVKVLSLNSSGVSLDGGSF